jgi:hypothetical protein
LVLWTLLYLIDYIAKLVLCHVSLLAKMGRLAPKE